LLSTKDLVFKERPMRKLIEQYVGPYAIEEVISSNAVKLQLPTSMRIHPVVNVSVVATTCHSRTNNLTTSKALSRAIK